MRRQQRLRRRQDFAAVYRGGQVYTRGPLVLRVRPHAAGEETRFGFAVGKRLGGAAQRNRIKRRLREAARRSGIKEGVDIVVIARASAGAASAQELEETLRSLLRKAGLTLEEARP